MAPDWRSKRGLACQAVAAKRRRLVGPGRVERPTSRLSGVRSNHLSYEPDEVSFTQQIPRGSAARIFDGRKGNEGGGTDCRLSKRCRKRSRERSAYADCFVASILRKEVIQPQVPLRLPCYDFTPVADPTVAGCLLAVSAPSSGNANSHGVTGGVYKARERIHRSLLFCDY